MSWMRSLLGLLILLVVLGFSLLFNISNDLEVPLNILVADLSPQPLAVWLILAFFLGGVLGVLAASFGLIRLKAKTLGLQRKVKQLEGERNKLSVGGSH